MRCAAELGNAGCARYSSAVGEPKRGWKVLGVVGLALCGACSANHPAAAEGVSDLHTEAGFVDIAPRSVVLNGQPLSLSATSKIFYNFRPADTDAATRPVIVLFNGFASDVVRAFGTGPMTVTPDGQVVPNPDSLTRFANLLYIDPRQAGFSYDVFEGRAGTDADCSQQVFSEYVDAADVLLATLHFTEAHPALHGPLYWMGESYAGVRITWILAYLRKAWALAPYEDETLSHALAQVSSARFLSGQVLLQPWLAGPAQANAIQEACANPALLEAVQASVPEPCSGTDACACAKAFARSPYNFSFKVTEQDARIFVADTAQVAPQNAEALYGAKFESIAGLRSAERARGFKCSVADDQTPDQSALAALLGALPLGQSYNLAYSPLMTGKGSRDPDWRRQTRVGAAFLDNAQHVDTLISDGQRDLVCPELALAPALRAISSSITISESTDRLTFAYPSGARSVALRRYPSAGHMITMLEPAAFARDLQAWLAERPKPE